MTNSGTYTREDKLANVTVLTLAFADAMTPISRVDAIGIVDIIDNIDIVDIVDIAPGTQNRL